MDPQQTWIDLANAWQNRDWEAVLELAEALTEWLDKSGHPPKFEYPKELGADFDAATARTVSAFAARRAQSVLDDPWNIPRDVPFSLCCSICHNIGPTSDMAARADGWSNIQYIPTGITETFRAPVLIATAERSAVSSRRSLTLFHHH